MALDYATAVTRVRLLTNDINEAAFVFTDEEVNAFLDLEGNSIKLAAAQIIDTIADNEVLVAKVLRTQDLTTDGAKAADALHKRAAELRKQAADDLALAEDADGGGCFTVPVGCGYPPELTEPCLPYGIAW